MRGFQPASLGPRDAEGFARGGRSKFVASTEFLFPLPSGVVQQGIRMFTFVDVGNVFEDKFDFGDLRASAGVGVNWISPIGPLKLSVGYPLRRKPEDKLQSFQFQIGTGF